jgi:hypothetical protein
MYHAAGRTGRCRYELALKIARRLKSDKNLFSSTTTDQLKQLANRPTDSSLEVGKTEGDLGLRMPTIDEALDRFSKVFAGAGNQRVYRWLGTTLKELRNDLFGVDRDLEEMLRIRP